MVVLSAAICTKSGKALISRQFVEMTRIRIEGLLAAFPKLLGSDSKQHTFVETESVRYVYQPMDNLYLLLITNRASNIVEDLETLRLLSKVVPDVAGAANNLTEEKISDKCFDLIFAFDEVITAGGYRETITLQQIRTNMEMESHEEKLHNMIKISKMESAKDQARDAARTIKERQKEQQRLGLGMVGIGSGSGPSLSSLDSEVSSSPSSGQDIFAEPRTEALSTNTSLSAGRSSGRAVAVKGMSLSAMGGKSKSLEDALVKEDKLAPIASVPSKALASDPIAPVQPAVQQPVMLVVAERVSAKMSRDGNVNSFEIKGGLTLTANDDSAALCSVQLAVGSVDAFVFNTHPKVNKQVYDKSGLLQLKDQTKGFPSARPVGILKWSHSSTSDDLVPIKVNCWPEEESRGQMNVSIEYSMEQPALELHNVLIRIPLGTHDAPNVLSVDGSFKHNAGAGDLVWEIPLIDRSNATGSLEFNIAQRNGDAFFPITVQFSSPKLFCEVEVTSVRTSDGSAPILYGITKGMAAEEYSIE